MILAINPGAELVDILRRRAAIAKEINSSDESDILATIKDQTKEFLEQLEENEHNLAGARGRLDDIHGTNAWTRIKANGISVLKEPNFSEAKQLLLDLKALGVFVVPGGELESWINLGTKRKNKWIGPAVEQISAGNCPSPLKEFVADIFDYLKGS